MNGTRLMLSLLLVGFPAMALSAVRRTSRPRAWAHVLAISLGSGFVLVMASLLHAALPLVFAILGFPHLAAACRAMGGHLFHAAVPFNVFAGGLALMVGAGAMRGVVLTVRAQSGLRQSARLAKTTSVGGHVAVLLPLGQPWAMAVPGIASGVGISASLIAALERRELDAVVRHERAHLEHHHVRFLLLGTAVTSGLWFLPWMKQAALALSLSLERWADESASAGSRRTRTDVSSALRKLSIILPSESAKYRIEALETDMPDTHHHEWGWPTAVSALVPLALALTITLLIHLQQVVAAAGVT